MRDANSEYPLRPPQKRAQNPFDNDADTLPESPLRRGPMHQREKPTNPTLPAGGARKMLSISLVAGILAAITNIVFTLVNTPLYHRAASYSHRGEMPLEVASAVVGLFVLTGVIGLIIYFIAGFITGKVAVARKFGFFGGFMASAINQIIGFIVGQIPNYPGKINSGISSNLLNIGGGLITALIILVLVALIGGLLGWLGAKLATRRHPFYVGLDG